MAVLLTAALTLTGAAPAHADDGASGTGGSLDADLKDSNGVPAGNYGELFIDRGDITHPDKMWVSGIIDLPWAMVYNVIIWAIGVFKWVLEFSWVDVIATPIVAIAKLLQTFLGQFGIIPFVLFLASLLIGFLFMRGKWSAALLELGVVACLATLALGVFSNPLSTLLDNGGAIDTATKFGSQASAALTGNGYVEELDTDDASVASVGVTAPLVDIFLKRGSQLVSFGHVLTGDCEKKFNDAVASLKPTDFHTNTVRDAVSGCGDESAKSTSSNPQPDMIWRIWVLGIGAFPILGLGMGFTVLLMIAVSMSLYKSVVLMKDTIVGMVPFSDRSKFYSSLVLTYVGLISIALLIAMLGLYLKFTVDILNASAGFGLEMQMNFVGSMLLIMLVLLVIQLIKMRREGQKLADKISTMMQAGKTAADKPIRFIPPVDRLIPQRRNPTALPGDVNDNRSVVLVNANGSGPPTPPIDGGEFDVVPPASRPGPSPSSKPGSGTLALGNKAVNAALTAGRVVSAAASGGSSLAATEAAKIFGAAAARAAVQKARQSRVTIDESGRGHIKPESLTRNSRTSAAPDRSTQRRRPPVRRERTISIDSNGRGQVLPRPVPNISSMPR